MEQPKIIKTKVHDKIGELALPFDNEQFKDFMVSLLGKPQSITKKIYGSFEIDKETICDVHEIIEKRVHQQNDGKLIQFRATIYYNDDSTVTLSGYDHLVDFNEPLPLYPVAIHLTWQYIIKFRDKDAWEKQEITVSFITPYAGPVTFDDNYFHEYTSLIHFRVNHTARTWGADIEGILSKHFVTLTKKESKFKEFYRSDPIRFERLFWSLLMLISMVFGVIMIIKLRESSLPVASLIHQYFRIGLVFLGTHIFASTINSFWENIDFDREYSFILLSKEAIKNREKSLRQKKNNIIKLIIALFVSILTSLIANYVFLYLTNTST